MAKPSPLVLGSAATLTVAVTTWMLYGGGFVNYDAMWSLVWGDELARFHKPNYTALAAPTPHPLSNVVGMILAPLGAASETGLHMLGFIAVGAFAVATWLLAQRLFGLTAAIVAGVLLLSRDTLLQYGSLAYLDVPYAAFILGAVAIEARKQKAGIPTLALLAVAGLLRPEAWFVAAGYLIYINGWRDWRAILLTVAAPVLWAASDLLATGDPTFSFTYTTGSAAELDRITGLEVFIEGPRLLGQQVRPGVVVAAALGLVVAWKFGRGRFLLGWTAAIGAATVVPALAGGPLNARYLLPVIALACVAAADAVAAPPPASDKGRRVWQATAVLAGLALLVTLPQQANRLLDTRDRLSAYTGSRDVARNLLAHGVPCRPLIVPNHRLRPLASVWADLPLQDVINAREGVPRRGSFISGTAKAMDGFVTIPGDTAEQLPRDVGDGRIVRRAAGWTVGDHCR